MHALLRFAVAPVAMLADVDEVTLPACLGESERLRWAQLPHAARLQFVASRSLLRELLQAATGVAADRWELSAQAGSAPTARIRHGGVAASVIHTSLSHRLGWVAAAVSDAPVGVDLECARPSRSDPAERAALMLSHSELASWRRLASSRQEAALLTLWTAKEAWFKASPPGSAPWDFRRVRVRACALGDGGANVRTWTSAPVHLALCSPDERALAAVRCDLPAPASSWHVQRVDSSN